jgi:flagellar hook-associated protein 3 FlgL
MRVTSNILVRDQLSALQTTASALAQAQARLTTGKKISTASEDPVGSRDVMATDGRLRAITQYRRGLESAKQRLAVQDSVMSQVSSIMTRAQELTVAANTATLTPTPARPSPPRCRGCSRKSSRSATRWSRANICSAGTRAPCVRSRRPAAATTVSYTTTGADGDRALEVDAGRTVVPTDDGATLFLDTGVLDSLRDLAAELSGRRHRLRLRCPTSGRDLSTAFNRVQERVGSLGARSNTLDLVAANLDAFEGSLQVFRSSVMDVDIEQAAVDLIQRQNAYQSALLASSKVLALNLADYL